MLYLLSAREHIHLITVEPGKRSDFRSNKLEGIQIRTLADDSDLSLYKVARKTQGRTGEAGLRVWSAEYGSWKECVSIDF